MRNTALALVGLLALFVYILACTSFSPDDTKVLYPAFDGASGAVGVAVYDREKAGSDLAFVPMAADASDTNRLSPMLVRSQWLADGQNILLCWPGDKESDGLTLAEMPWNAPAPLRLFNLPKIENYDFTRPLCVAGDRVFLMESKKQVLRFDLKTGAVVRHALAGGESEFTLLPDANGRGVFYMGEGQGPASRTVFGRLNPDDFALTPLAGFTNEIVKGSFFAYDPGGQRCAFLEEAQPLPQVVVLEGGKPVFRRPIGAKGEELAFASAVFSKRGDSLLAGFQRKREGQPGSSYGLMEIPLQDQPVRETVLISGSAVGGSDNAAFFEFGISHDGKTAAVASTYLACAKDQDLKAEDCALFFIDLSDPNWKVTKVPIPMPRQQPAAARK
jgi:hypothetical protein